MNRNLILALALPTVIVGVSFLGVQTLQNRNQDSQVISESKQLMTATNQATVAVELGKSAKTKNQWRTVAQTWEKAIAQMKTVPTDSGAYDLAQEKIVEYQGYLNIARDRVKTASSTNFSGYSDLANAISSLLGFKPIENFNMPYRSQSLQ